MQINSVQNLNFNQGHNNKTNKELSFKGIGGAVMNGVGKFFQVCDDVPMIGVAFTDTAATDVPRTLVDLKQTGVPAAAETARREFSGLIVNCLIPGVFVYGAAKLINDNYMKDFPTPIGKPTNLTKSWANGEAISNLVGVWKNYIGIGKDFSLIKDPDEIAQARKIFRNKPFGDTGFVKSALAQIEGLNGVDSWDKLSDHKNLIDKAAELLEPAMKGTARPKNLIQRFKDSRERSQALKNAYDVLVKGQYVRKDELGRKVVEVIDENGGFRATQTLKFNGKNIGSDLRNFLRDTADIGAALSISKEARMNPDKFIKQATKLVNAKSLMGLAVVIPLAMSVQTINRAITRHKYKKSGAPIYKDFENENRELTDDEKKQLKVTKPLAVGSIVGLAALSMGKTFPRSLSSAVEMLQFNTKFPTLNQCRVIATSTFASRMLAAEDPNELRESTVRDLASFAGLYFLGDYAEKLAATAVQKFSKKGRTGELQMFNKTKKPEEYKNAWQKFTGWIKDTNIKTFDEIAPEHKNYRSLAKLGGLGFSLVFLGVLLPMYNKYVTNKKEAKRKAILEQQKKQSNIYNPKTVFPSNIQKKEPIDPIEESKKHFQQMKSFSSNPAFSKISSKFIG